MEYHVQGESERNSNIGTLAGTVYVYSLAWSRFIVDAIEIETRGSIIDGNGHVRLLSFTSLEASSIQMSHFLF
jgi:hypothetical protein